ncbi:MAG: 50S ribosomal protein L22 [Ignavibacteriae bacterium]|nr:50S ribosomal protein L22 [Ignavibacteriota bacterium]MCB9242763.1 50S ribosomal protein L22 [Ignavibacteriales bacterium]
MEARAIKRYSKGSPRKMRLVVDLIRNRSVQDAVGILRFSKNHSADVVEKAVVSAYNNLENKLDGGRLSMEDVFVSEAYVDGGPSYKRLLPAPQGRAYRVRKRTAHVTIIVSNGEEEELVEEEIPEDEEVVDEDAVQEEDTDEEDVDDAEDAEDDQEESEEVEEIEDEEDESPLEKNEDDQKEEADYDGDEADEEEQELNR